ncbi:MAG: hypothetical protein A3C44_02535 [Gammaproteobacteria bacterium RIFCSPHIGHO2_02_FULL_39_13]|nr:MAG: hypothetical protein A3C44_02535 [Gammaproteobacteria bacterium RIFCSPHIGHO2_02_FULL_39_13]OGT50146.1 MAG: hypothetical protein A3E53_01840 [Gammaproteobacteria bacterium RIFCSPHIGHO2_12_FULL_39_24]
MDDQALKMSIALIAVIFVVMIFFCWTLYQLLESVPKKNHLVPSWLVWLILVPWIQVVFEWIMLPFAIPSALRKTFPDNEAAQKAIDTLFNVGLAQVIVLTFSFLLPIRYIDQLLAVAGLVLWIIYWVKIVKFKKTYLTGMPT